MQLTYQSDLSLQVKTAEATVAIDGEVRIGSYQVPGAGEFDVHAVQCESEYVKEALVYFLRTEDITLTFLTSLDPSVSDHDDASNTDILIVALRSDDKPETLKTILKSLEPAYLFLTGYSPDEEFVKQLGLPTQAGTLKTTKGTLPESGTTLIVA